MAKQTDSVYKVVDVVGTSTNSWDDAAKNAVETAGGTLRDLRVAEIVKLDPICLTTNPPSSRGMSMRSSRTSTGIPWTNGS
jgi:flavin-binding protein dodecin